MAQLFIAYIAFIYICFFGHQLLPQDVPLLLQYGSH
jgi:hypothetical protein